MAKVKSLIDFPSISWFTRQRLLFGEELYFYYIFYTNVSSFSPELRLGFILLYVIKCIEKFHLSCDFSTSYDKYFRTRNFRELLDIRFAFVPYMHSNFCRAWHPISLHAKVVRTVRLGWIFSDKHFVLSNKFYQSCRWSEFHLRSKSISLEIISTKLWKQVWEKTDRLVRKAILCFITTFEFFSEVLCKN